MRASYTALLVLTLSVAPLGNSAQGVAQMAQNLKDTNNYLTDATFQVWLPSAEDPVTYSLTLQSDATPADSLSPCEYLIRWESESKSGNHTGFSAYFDGSHYRYRNNRLQEYHFTDNPAAFRPVAGPGVQSQAQFADLLPQFLALRMEEIANDTAYDYKFHPDTIVSGKRAVVIDGTKRTQGYDSQYFTYAFDFDTQLPMKIELETSPGTISEQIISVKYEPGSRENRIEYNEDALVAQWPEVFEKYRESTFRAESLKGQPLPSFSCQALNDDKRMEHLRGEGLVRTSIFVFLDPEVASTQATIQDVRSAANQLPTTVDIIWVFQGNHEDEISELLGSLMPAEAALTSAGSLIRNCGVNLYPTILVVGSDGIVREVTIAYNQNLSEIVISNVL